MQCLIPCPTSLCSLQLLVVGLQENHYLACASTLPDVCCGTKINKNTITILHLDWLRFKWINIKCVIFSLFWWKQTFLCGIAYYNSGGNVHISVVYNDVRFINKRNWGVPWIEKLFAGWQETKRFENPPLTYRSTWHKASPGHHRWRCPAEWKALLLFLQSQSQSTVPPVLLGPEPCSGP